MRPDCEFADENENGLVRCLWMSRRLGYPLANTPGVCTACQAAGPPGPDHPRLHARVHQALLGRILSGPLDNDAMFHGLTRAEAYRRLREAGVTEDMVKAAMLKAVATRGFPLDLMEAVAGQCGLS